MDLIAKEHEIIRYWAEHEIEGKARRRNRGAKRFYFLDGPPYVTGELHPAHIWVKTLKDIFVRYKRYRGFDVIDRAGYDVHGLPIENKVEKLLGVSSKKEIESRTGIERFVSACKQYVSEYIGRMDSDYARYGVSLDFKNPYLPHTKQYMETAWELFKRISDKGHLYKGTKTLIYCPHCETPLSQGSMEVEYEDDEDPSIYVAFKIDRDRSKAKIDVNENSYLIVWTTTPWTLPSNVSIAANPREEYVAVRSEGKVLILAKRRLDAVAAALNRSFTVIGEFMGSEMEGIHYISPLEDRIAKQKELRRYHRIILSEGLVSMEEGTGLVHMAPGNGVDDYREALANKLPIFNVVGPDARFTEGAGAYAGLAVPEEANAAVVRDLEGAGSLLGRGTIRHSYPHCWRCHSKLIFLATEQWFLKMGRLKKRLVAQNERISWHPGQVREWERSVLENPPDWCISRQRYWGIPMPVWSCGNCGDIDVIGSMAELKGRATDMAAVEQLTDMHRPYIDAVELRCRKCGGVQRRVKDVLDVWFDSSIAFRASLTQEQFGDFLPTELVVEYIGQTRGWFQYMLKVGLMAYGRNPFRHIMVTGVMAGTDGKKMSKSLGNFKPLEELSEFAAADAFRLWSVARDPIQNVDLNNDEIKENEKAINILHNISRLIGEYESLYRYKPKAGKRMRAGGLESLDAWILSRLEGLVGTATKSLDAYDTATAAEAIRSFIIGDFSQFYLKNAKERMGSKRTAKRAIDTIDHVLFKTIIIASPFIPFVCESVYLDRYKGAESIFFEKWPKEERRLRNEALEKEIGIVMEAIAAILGDREKRNAKLRAPILSATIEAGSDDALSVMSKHSGIICSYTNAKELRIKRGSPAGREVRPVFAKIGPDFKAAAGAVAEELRKADPSKMEEGIASHGYYPLHTSMGTFDIKPEHFFVVEEREDPGATSFRHGRVSIDTTMTEELRRELLVREVLRRIQIMRKEASLTRDQEVRLYLSAEPALVAVLKASEKGIKETARAKRLIWGAAPGGAILREWEISGAKVSAGIEIVAAD